MGGSGKLSGLEDYVSTTLALSAPQPARVIARALSKRFPDAAIFLYGSGLTVSAATDPTEIIYDFYVITPSYERAFASGSERIAARLIPPNVYYTEEESDCGTLRAKYAVLSLEHFRRLASERTFHSYFWARFAQPMRLLAGPQTVRDQSVEIVCMAVRTFLERARPLAKEPSDWRAVWLSGLQASYRSELRAESADRAEKVLDHIGDWAVKTSSLTACNGAFSSFDRRRALFEWRLRAVQGGFLSAARLLKATATFEGGIEYIAWKIKRHAGIDLDLRKWERRHPFFAAPIVALRYFRLRANMRAASRSQLRH